MLLFSSDSSSHATQLSFQTLILNQRWTFSIQMENKKKKKRKKRKEGKSKVHSLWHNTSRWPIVVKHRAEGDATRARKKGRKKKINPHVLGRTWKRKVLLDQERYGGGIRRRTWRVYRGCVNYEMHWLYTFPLSTNVALKSYEKCL